MIVDGEATLIVAALGGDQDAFQRLTEPFSRELHLHCYRMMGSLHDAEDLVQETLLRAWQRLDSFEGRSTFRAWLYRVATNACLNAIERRQREVPAIPRARGNGYRADEVPHLEPYPDILLDWAAHAENGDTPEAQYELRESISLAFQVALQVLPPRQRAALILGDVLGFSPREMADLMGSSVASVNSALQRARQAVRSGDGHRNTVSASATADQAERQIVERFVQAWERQDIDALVSLLTEDGLLVMPPRATRIVGRRAIAEFLSTVPANGRLDHIRLVTTAANGQPAFACYLLDPATGACHAYGIMVLTVEGEAITAITGFPTPSFFGAFHLPSSF